MGLIRKLQNVNSDMDRKTGNRKRRERTERMLWKACRSPGLTVLLILNAVVKSLSLFSRILTGSSVLTPQVLFSSLLDTRPESVFHRRPSDWCKTSFPVSKRNTAGEKAELWSRAICSPQARNAGHAWGYAWAQACAAPGRVVGECLVPERAADFLFTVVFFFLEEKSATRICRHNVFAFLKQIEKQFYRKALGIFPCVCISHFNVVQILILSITALGLRREWMW